MRLRDHPADRVAIPRGRAIAALGALALVAGLALGLMPFSSTFHGSDRSISYSCGLPYTAWRRPNTSANLLPFLRALSKQHRGTTPTTLPKTSSNATSNARFDQVIASAERYSACQPAGAHRMFGAVALGLVGIVLLAWWWFRLPPKPESAEAASAAGPGFRYQPALDGVRAISILLVLTRHLGLRGFFVSGDHGVDVFFVLSGFLITTLLLNEHRLSGHISLSRFYVRRVLRLYPVVLLLLAVGAFVIIVDPSFPTAPHWSGLAATSFYYANWFHGVNPVAMGFLAPTWSLAIEEQFYLVWPPIVLLLIARSRGRSGLAFLAGAGAVAAALYRLAIWEPALGRPARGIAGVPLANLRFHAFNDWYFNSFSRADTILVGCVLALTLTPAVVAKLKDRPALVTRLMWLATLIAVYICLRETILGGRKEDAPGARYGNSDFVPIWGLAVFEVCVALVILGLVVLPGSRMASVLSNRALVWTGRRSYALYVLHTPIFDTFDHFRVVHGYYLPMVVKLIASFVAAALSYRLIEAPVLRLKDRYAGRLASRRDAPASLPADALSNQRV